MNLVMCTLDVILMALLVSFAFNIKNDPLNASRTELPLALINFAALRLIVDLLFITKRWRIMPKAMNMWLNVSVR